MKNFIDFSKVLDKGVLRPTTKEEQALFVSENGVILPPNERPKFLHESATVLSIEPIDGAFQEQGAYPYIKTYLTPDGYKYERQVWL